MNSEIEETETSRFKIVAERAYFWNFLVNVAISNETLTIILNFMQATTYIFAGTYILKFLGKNGTEFLNKLGSMKNFLTTKNFQKDEKSRGKK